MDGISRSVLLEAKDWKGRLRIADLGQILAKFSRHPTPRICLIFCHGKYAMDEISPSDLKKYSAKLSADEQATFKSSLVLFAETKRQHGGGSSIFFRSLIKRKPKEPEPVTRRLVLLLPLGHLTAG